MTIKPFDFEDAVYTDTALLLAAMGTSWEAGKQVLFSGRLRTHLQEDLPEMAKACRRAEREAGSRQEDADGIFLRWLCQCPEIRSLYYAGTDYGDLQDIRQRLTGGKDRKLEQILGYMLEHQFFSAFVRNVSGEERLAGYFAWLEKEIGRKEKKMSGAHAAALVPFLLKGDTSYTLSGDSYDTPEALAAFLQTQADRSKASLSRAIRPAFRKNGTLDPAFEAFLILHDRGQGLSQWRTRFAGDAEEPAETLPKPEEKKENTPQGNIPEDVEERFTGLLRDYRDRLTDPVAFQGLLSDIFPGEELAKYLLLTLYRMEIMKAIEETENLGDLFVLRFEKRMNEDLGIQKPLARWAAYTWCQCYGKGILGKENRVSFSGAGKPEAKKE